MLLTSTVSQAINDVAFMTKALETAGRVDTEVVAGPIKGALVDICTDKKKRRYLTKKRKKQPSKFSIFKLDDQVLSQDVLEDWGRSHCSHCLS